MNTSFRKVWRDLWRNKGRTFMVIMSISVGVMAVGMVVSGNILVLGQMARSHVESNPAHAMLWLRGIVNEDTIRSLKRIPSVKDIEGYAESGIHWKTSLDGEWQNGHIITYANFETQTFDRLTLKDGAWPENKLIG
jgi:putative ABC transport system permease protein